jgi:YD repeat-containing protein
MLNRKKGLVLSYLSSTIALLLSTQAQAVDLQAQYCFGATCFDTLPAAETALIDTFAAGRFGSRAYALRRNPSNDRVSVSGARNRLAYSAPRRIASKILGAPAYFTSNGITADQASSCSNPCPSFIGFNNRSGDPIDMCGGRDYACQTATGCTTAISSECSMGEFGTDLGVTNYGTVDISEDGEAIGHQFTAVEILRRVPNNPNCNFPGSVSSVGFCNGHIPVKCPVGYQQISSDGVCGGGTSTNINIVSFDNQFSPQPRTANSTASGASISYSISPLSGTVNFSEEDYIASNLSFTRHYKSAAHIGNSHYFGMGWSHNYAYEVLSGISSSQKSIHILNEQGDIERYQCNTALPCTQFTSQDGTTDMVTRNGLNEIELTRSTGTVYKFDTSGRLEAIANNNIPTQDITLTYDIIDRLTLVQDENGNQLTFNYDEQSNQLSEVLLPNSDTVSFTYQTYQLGPDHNDHYRLASAIRTNAVSHYGYNDVDASNNPRAQHLITDVLDIQNISILSVDYDDVERVTAIERASGTDRYTVSYMDDPALSGSWNFTEVTFPNLSVTRYDP